MKLIDLLSVTSESTDVVVLMNETEIARYDGKNSISEELNDIEVIKQFTSGNVLNVKIASTPVKDIEMDCWIEFERPLSKDGLQAKITSNPMFKIMVDGVERTIGFNQVLDGCDSVCLKRHTDAMFLILRKPNRRLCDRDFDALTYDALARGDISIADTEPVVSCAIGGSDHIGIKKIIKLKLGGTFVKVTQSTNTQPKKGRKE